MTEHATHSPEHHAHKHEQEPMAEHTTERHERTHTPEKEVSQHEKHRLEQEAKQHAQETRETHIGGQEQEQAQPIGLQRDLKIHAYKQTMRKIRSHLSRSEKTFSKVIHQPAVDAVSETTGKTLFRPSGVLGGGLLALLGSGFILYMGKHYGFKYNFFAVIFFFVMGFSLGLITELMLKAYRKAL